MNTVRIIKWLRIINGINVGDVLLVTKPGKSEHFKLAKKGFPAEFDLYSIDTDNKVWGLGADNLEEFKKYFLIDGIKGYYEDIDLVNLEKMQ